MKNEKQRKAMLNKKKIVFKKYILLKQIKNEYHLDQYTNNAAIG